MKLWKALIVIPALNFATVKSFAAAPACTEVFAKQSSGKKLSPLFQTNTAIVELELTGDFNKIYEASKGGNWTGEERNDPKYFSMGTLRDLGNPKSLLSVAVRARGMSSLSEGEASFPKLKVEIDKTQDLDNSLFKGSRNFRINTHVSTHPTTVNTPAGRLNNENSPWREALGYSLAQKLNLLTPATKLARIQYVDSVTKEKFQRQALLIETDKNTKERLEATELGFDDIVLSQVSKVNPVEAARFFLFHAIVGNGDVNLRVHERSTVPTEKYRPLFNTYVVNTPERKGTPVVYDLDLSTIVGGKRFGEVKPIPMFKIGNVLELGFATALAELRQRFTAQELSVALTELKQKKAELYKIIAEANVDADGRTIAKSLLDASFNMIDAVMSYDLINVEGLQIYADANKSKSLLKMDPASEEPGTLRPGTPVVVLGKEKGLLKVAILDLRVDAKSDASDNGLVIGYIDANAKISKVLNPQLIGLLDNRDMLWQIE